MKKFKAFTLSEMMVALVVIGVIVAVITPTIMKTKPNSNKMMVKKSFYTTEQTVNSLINDENLYPDMREICETNSSSNDDNVYCAWGFDYTSDAKYEGETYSGDTKFAELFKSKLNIKTVDASNSLIFYTTDGIKWDLSDTKGAWTHSSDSKVGTFDNQTGATGIGTIKIDVNGDGKPNLPCTEANTNCDQYEIQILSSGKMRINPTYSRAVNYATINTAIKDQ